MAEYNSAYTGEQIDDRLGKVPELEQSLRILEDSMVGFTDEVETATKNAAAAANAASNAANSASSAASRANSAASDADSAAGSATSAANTARSQAGAAASAASNANSAAQAANTAAAGASAAAANAESAAAEANNVASEIRQAKENGEFDGSDANVTAANIQAALGYKPADEEKVNQLSSENEKHGEKLESTNIAYGTCSTDATTAAKTVAISENDHWELKVGSVVMVYFTISNSASNVTLNVNNTGAYPIWYNNAEYTSNATQFSGHAKRVITYMFNGTHWVWICGSYDANTTYKNTSLGQGYVTCDTAEATTAKVGTLSSYALTLGGIVAVKFTYAVPVGSTLNINSKGAKAMFHRGAAITAGVIKAGDIATFIYDGTQYQLLSVDRWREGEDGFSPTISVSEVDGGHRLTIIDINGTKTVDVMDGKNGKDGAGGSGDAETYETVVNKMFILY